VGHGRCVDWTCGKELAASTVAEGGCRDVAESRDHDGANVRGDDACHDWGNVDFDGGINRLARDGEDEG
jgi:hypothetical protein